MDEEFRIKRDRRYNRLINWEKKHGADRLHIHKPKFFTRDLPFVFAFLAVLGLFWYLISKYFLSLFFDIDFPFDVDDPLLGLVGIIIWIPLTAWLYLGLSTIWESLALAGYYITSNEFVKVLAYPFYTKISKRPLSSVVTIEVLKTPKNKHHMLKVIFSVTKLREYGFMTWFTNSASVIEERYRYFGEEQGYRVSHIWGEDIETGGNLKLDELQEIELLGKTLLSSYTGKPIEFFYPYLHCKSCKTLNVLEAIKCENCNTEIIAEFPNVPTSY